jgi:hypothetical protein
MNLRIFGDKMLLAQGHVYTSRQHWGQYHFALFYMYTSSPTQTSSHLSPALVGDSTKGIPFFCSGTEATH